MIAKRKKQRQDDARDEIAADYEAGFPQELR
jgi:hypothetical protein